ncbi:MAG: precorrin-8X methylmutase [Ahrensia sp.]|nr:precorrin-8X methylmutase [Ahrensia sp.]
MEAFDYLRDPAAIYRQSFATIEAEADFAGLDADALALATRMIHACGMVDIVKDIEMSRGAVAQGRRALGDGAVIFCDVEMVRHGIIRRNLPKSNDVICTLDQPRLQEHAEAHETTRSAAAVDFWDHRLAGSVVVIGNAPTALFRLLERIAGGGPKPALIIGVPVGFVGAIESKQALATQSFDVSFITLHGRRGGSALAAAALNAVAVGLAT